MSRAERASQFVLAAARHQLQQLRGAKAVTTKQAVELLKVSAAFPPRPGVPLTSVPPPTERRAAPGVCRMLKVLERRGRWCVSITAMRATGWYPSSSVQLPLYGIQTAGSEENLMWRQAVGHSKRPGRPHQRR
jgi:hypothetical protein